MKNKIALLLLAIVFISEAPASFGQSVNRPLTYQSGTKGMPNIVIFCADALGISDLGCYGSEIKTPAIDKIASQGVRFTQFYNSGSATSTRASLMTGQYPHNAGLGYKLVNLGMPGYRGTINIDTPTLAEILKVKAGYKTIMVGRWGLSIDHDSKSGQSFNWPTNRGFDFFYGTTSLSDNQFNPATLKMGDKPFPAIGQGFYYMDAIARYAGDFLNEASKSGKPFFLYVSLPGPFMPLQIPTSELRNLNGSYAIGWDQVRQSRYQRMLAMHTINSTTKLSPRDKDVPDWGKMGPYARWQSLRMDVYAAQVQAMDRAVGEILKSVQIASKGSDTLIIFLSSSGANATELPEGFKGSQYMSPTTRSGQPILSGNNPRIAPGTEKTYQSYGVPWANVSNTPYRGYAEDTYEGSLASPCIIAYPRMVTPGRVTHQVAHVTDIIPTILDIIEVAYPQSVNGYNAPPLPGISLKGVFQMKTREHPPLFWEYKGNIAIRSGKWKLVAQYNPAGEDQRVWELYDLEVDRAESNNLVGDYGSVAQELFRNYSSWAKKNNVRAWKEVSDRVKAVQKRTAPKAGKRD
ncbi:MAG: sulfatase-like hydrolase/transferase [Thermoguttaceae bacterium]|nr:sulfatase-like hydrolase/transferase [Thermoguttaceae bacterium]